MLSKKLSIELVKFNTNIKSSNISVKTKYIKKKQFNKILFFFVIWGDEYINNFSNNCLRFLINSNFHEIKIYKKQSELIIWTSKKDKKILQANINYIKIKKLIKVNIIEIDFLLKIIKKFEHKYKFLLFLQKVFISSRSDNDIIFLLYPDFLFSNNSIKNALDKIVYNNYDTILAPVPQLIKENYEKLILKDKSIFKNKKKLLDFSKNNIHDIVNRTICNNKIFDSRLSLLSYFKKNKFLLIKSFHIHPLAIRAKFNSGLLSLDGDSLDEQFINQYVEKFYIPESSDEMVFFSLLEKNAYTMAKNLDYNSLTHTLWLFNHTGFKHLEFFKNNYFIYYDKKNIKNDKIKSIERIDNLARPLLSSLNLKINELIKYYPEYYRLREIYYSTNLNNKKPRIKFQLNYNNFIVKHKDKNNNKNINLDKYFNDTEKIFIKSLLS